jgi:hypothetical protein
MEKKNRIKKMLLISFILNILLIVLCFYGYRSFLIRSLLKPSQENSYSYPYYNGYVSMFNILPATKADIVFCGCSLTLRCCWQEAFPDYIVLNRGIDGDVSEGLLNRLKSVENHRPDKIFILIGINDIWQGINCSTTTNNLRKIITQFKKSLPDTKIYLQSVLPTSNEKDRLKIQQLNNNYQLLAKEENVEYVNLYTKFCSADGKMKSAYVVDGVHLNGEGYMLWINEIKRILKK